MLTVSTAIAQPEVIWSETYGGEAVDECYQMAITNDGGFVFSGDTRSFGAGGIDVYLVKTNADGDLIWSQTYGGGGTDQGYSLTQTADDGYAIGGTTTSGNGAFDFYLIKTDAEGEQEWARVGYGRGGYDHCQSIIQTPGGGYSMAGKLDGNRWDAHLIQTDEEGNSLWARSYHRQWSEVARSHLRLGDGGFIFAGFANIPNQDIWDVYVVRTDEEGNQIWARSYGGDDSDLCMSIIETDDGNFVLAGWTNSFGQGGEDFYLIKIDEDGEELWSQTYGGEDDDQCFSVIQVADGGFALAGGTRSFGEGEQDMLMIRTNDEGEELWSFTAGGEGNDVCRSVVITQDGGYGLGGNTESFGAGALDLWLLKTSPDPLLGDIEPPLILVDPGLIEAEGSSEHVINISNVGEGILWWRTAFAANWVSCDPSRGNIEPESDQDVFVIIDAEDLRPGVYEDVLRILSNDPERRETQIPVTLWVQAQIIHVPEDFGTIDQAINNANHGDSILVSEGEYLENIDYSGKEICIIGNPDNPEDVILSGAHRNGSVVTFTNGESELAILSGFTIINGSGTLIGRDRKGGGIYCNESRPALKHLIIRDNNAAVGGGIYCFRSNPTIDNVIVTENEGRDGGGMNFEESTPILTDTEISENYAGWGGGGIYCGEAHPTLTRVLLSYNVSEEIGGGIMIVGNSTLSLTNVTISRNEAGETGGGVHIRVNSQVAIRNSILWDNQPQEISFVQVDNDVIDISYTDLMDGRDGIAGDGVVIWGRGNIDADPLFVNPENNGFQLTVDSPCIDTGDPRSPLDPDNSQADIGAFYFNQANGVVFSDSRAPSLFYLSEAFPNPFNSKTKLTYSLPNPSHVSVGVYDIFGREIAVLVDAFQPAGNYTTEWNGIDVGSGIYFVRLEAGKYRAVRKVMLLR